MTATRTAPAPTVAMSSHNGFGSQPHELEHQPPTGLLQGPLLTPADAAALLNVKTSWIYEATRTGRLPCIRLGRHIRFTRRMLEEWLSR